MITATKDIPRYEAAEVRESIVAGTFEPETDDIIIHFEDEDIDLPVKLSTVSEDMERVRATFWNMFHPGERYRVTE